MREKERDVRFLVSELATSSMQKDLEKEGHVPTVSKCMKAPLTEGVCTEREKTYV